MWFKTPFRSTENNVDRRLGSGLRGKGREKAGFTPVELQAPFSRLAGTPHSICTYSFAANADSLLGL